MTMRRLILLRHAKTERAEPGERDRDRKLMKRGRADAPIVGAYLAHHGLLPDLALSRPQSGRKKPGDWSPPRSTNGRERKSTSAFITLARKSFSKSSPSHAKPGRS